MHIGGKAEPICLSAQSLSLGRGRSPTQGSTPHRHVDNTTHTLSIQTWRAGTVKTPPVELMTEYGLYFILLAGEPPSSLYLLEGQYDAGRPGYLASTPTDGGAMGCAFLGQPAGLGMG